ncbi:TPA: plasmid mobilization relaxosome protein MobC [Klebsiella variicola subsp. variicola]|nr:plasmid mobilization relaxosome protein MobC [Klebsiella variicola subsp. variicola]HCI4627460.1 plasmid mobilization relaxosome protein MobC [Klebsiella variicola subsp. variicola]HCI6660943.1 plasmid mobilization relaxosome protein MobC [Klebsiella variicola subsp. variicola]
MLAMMIERVTSGEVDLEPKGLAEVKTNQINIKLPASKIDEITQRAKQEGFPSRTTWVVSVISQALDNKPVLNDEEANTIRASNRELSAIGRNLNQIARKLNIEFRDSDRLSAEAIERLSDAIEQHKTAVAIFLDKSQKRWD